MLRKEKKTIIDTKEIVQVLNDHYINIVKDLSGKNHYRYIKIVDHVFCHYEDHPSVRHIKRNIKVSAKLCLFFVKNIWTRNKKDTKGIKYRKITWI